VSRTHNSHGCRIPWVSASIAGEPGFARRTAEGDRPHKRPQRAAVPADRQFDYLVNQFRRKHVATLSNLLTRFFVPRYCRICPNAAIPRPASCRNRRPGSRPCSWIPWSIPAPP
jgi:hypothetical protein